MKIDYRSWAIGARHDPYGAHELSVTTTDGKEVSIYWDGLGTVRVSVNGEVAAESRSGKADDDQKLFDLFKEECGLTHRAALKYWERVHSGDCEPMGCPSMYV